MGINISNETKAKFRYVLATVGSFIIYVLYQLVSPIQEQILGSGMDLSWAIPLCNIIAAGAIAIGAVVVVIFGVDKYKNPPSGSKEMLHLDTQKDVIKNISNTMEEAKKV